MSVFKNVTEEESKYHDLEKMSVHKILDCINKEDALVPIAVATAIPQIEKLVSIITDKMLAGGRLFYIGAGSSGRLGILDASEIPPTFGMPEGVIIGLIAGGDEAIKKAIENAEDSLTNGWADLLKYKVTTNDIVVGIAASGTTPYVLGALQACKLNNIVTGSISCNLNSPISSYADYPIEVIVGPEFVTGSTRMKSGTAQKLVLNMISTAVMILIGRVEDNKMVNMQLTNDKLIDRGTKMLMQEIGIKDYEEAKNILIKNGSVKKAIDSIKED